MYPEQVPMYVHCQSKSCRIGSCEEGIPTLFDSSKSTAVQPFGPGTPSRPWLLQPVIGSGPSTLRLGSIRTKQWSRIRWSVHSRSFSRPRFLATVIRGSTRANAQWSIHRQLFDISFHVRQRPAATIVPERPGRFPPASGKLVLRIPTT